MIERQKGREREEAGPLHLYFHCAVPKQYYLGCVVSGALFVFGIVYVWILAYVECFKRLRIDRAQKEKCAAIVLMKIVVSKLIRHHTHTDTSVSAHRSYSHHEETNCV